ncbi:F0F1 ATP synthase subunit gamma [Orientia tsutsugamushi]|uniref:ATPase n=1 Tax=Orientia tsutsugamushi TaxID=784 RepID=A0A2U3RSW6_ORITS|nr:FoF1 ATP synthase subunit gamma [Orientia tsutsugamushi]KJV56679.1 ATP synthase family protein [Orientia tsutsugamushi str. Karp]SPR16228.1 ATPase [Orientia tsutsugamushi]
MTVLKQLRDRIKAVRSTQKVTKAMQLIASSRFRKLGSIMLEAENYLQIITEMLAGGLSGGDYSSLGAREQLMLGIAKQDSQVENKTAIILLIVLSSEQGLCGSFNSNILKELRHDVHNIQLQGYDFRLIIFGKRAYDNLLPDFGSKIISCNSLHHVEISTVVNFQQEIRKFTVDNANIIMCKVYYNKFINTVNQKLDILTLFPIKDLNFKKAKFSYELEGRNIISQIIDWYLIAKLFHIITLHKASEERSRIVAMEAATTNADDVIAKLTIQLNRSRQAAVTKELIEVISSAEAIT